MSPKDAPLKRNCSKKDFKKLLGAIHDRKSRVKMEEAFYGEHLEEELKNVSLLRLCDEQMLAMRLYETRFDAAVDTLFASLQRCMAFFVLFHQMGKHVADFWPAVSFGYL